MVLVTVLMVVMVMSIFMVSILSQSMSQTGSAKQDKDKIATSECVKGLFWKLQSRTDVSPGISPIKTPSSEWVCPDGNVNVPYEAIVTDMGPGKAYMIEIKPQ